MTVTIQTTKELENKKQEISFQPENAEAFELKEVEETVDKYGALKAKLEAQLEALKPLQKQVADLEQSLIGYADTKVAVDEELTLTGKTYEVKLSKMGKAAEIADKALLREMLGDETFFELAKVGITDVRAYLNPKQQAKVLTEEYKTKRRVKVEIKASE